MRNQIAAGGVLLAIGTLGAVLAKSVALPGGAVVGALLAVGVFQVACGKTATGAASLWPKRFGQVGRLVLGTIVGSAFSAQVLVPLRAAMLPMTGVVVVFTGMGFAMGWLLYRSGKVDLPTAIIGAVPGGLPAMIGIAPEMHADTTVVAAIHATRLASVLLLIPSAVAFLSGASHGAPAATQAAVPVVPIAFWHWIMTMVIGIVSGLLVARLGVPSGDLLGPILMVGGANVFGAGLGPLPGNVGDLAQVLVGVAAGAEFSRESLSRVKSVAVPAALGIAALILTGLVLGLGLALVTPIDLATALTSCAPGGASTLAAMATDMGADMRIVAALQLVRLLTILLLVPLVVQRVLSDGRPRGGVSGGCLQGWSAKSRG